MTHSVKLQRHCQNFAITFLMAAAVCPQTPSRTADATRLKSAQAATLRKVTAIRDTFLKRITALGFTCPMAAPTIVVEDVPSFGQYQGASNTLHTSDWTLLRPEERAFFFQLAGPNANQLSAHEVFEKAAHQWIFVHELGHWWQACQNASAKEPPYQVEYGANRIALAYWRESDASVVQLMMSLFHAVLDHTPSPVPPGEEVERYFNENYETLGPSPKYPWFQAHMGVRLEEEKPAPTLAAVLAYTKK